LRTGSRRRLLLLLISAPLVLAGVPALAETRTLSVVATFGAGAVLPPDATIEVELLDVSRADASSVRLASRRFRLRAVPALLRLPYDSAAIDERMTYVVAARVVSGDAVVMRTTSAFPVLTRGATDRVEIVLERMGARATEDSGANALAGVTWAATEIGGRALIAEDPPTVLFEEDGGFSMYGGCNRFRGRAEISDGRIAFVEPIAGTMMMCPPQRMSLERDMLDALQATAGYVRSGESLSLTNAAGVVVARFRAAPK
jgi:putative lipoprotein